MQVMPFGFQSKFPVSEWCFLLFLDRTELSKGSPGKRGFVNSFIKHFTKLFSIKYMLIRSHTIQMLYKVKVN